MPVKIVFCYAHEDEPLLNKLKSHLSPLRRQGLIDVWYDREISAGTEWEQEISKHLNEAEVILLLVSPDFINSDYCYSVEMKRAMERHAKGEAHVIPIILRHVYWQGTLGELQALPTDAKPVTSSHWHTLDEAFLDVIEGILKTFQELRKQPSTEEAPASYVPFSHEFIPTGFEDLDRIMGGGFQRSDFIIIGAPPSTGKTSFALNIVLNTAIKYARSVGIFSLEMSKKRLVQRLLSFITIIELLRQAQKLVNECKVELIIVDYVNLIQTGVNQN
jgi:replicative DNA helicase